MSRKRLRSETRRSKEHADASPKLIPVQKSDVPAYLHESEFFLSLEEDDGQPILVPRECLKNDDTVSNVEDLHSLLLTLRFWVLCEKIDSILNFVSTQPFELYEEVLVEFYDDMPDLLHLKAIVKSKEPFQKAICCGVLRFVQFMYMTEKYEWPEDVCEYLAAKGDLDMLKYASASGCELTIQASSDELDCLKFLHEHNCPWDETTTDAAVTHGSLACLKYAHENGCPWNDMDAQEYAKVEGEYDWSNVCSGAAMYGHIDCLKYAYSQGVPLLADLHEKAVSFNNNDALECVKFAHDCGLSFQGEFLCEDAVLNQNLEMLTYLHENGCPWRSECFNHAIDRRNKGILEYLRISGCPWDSSVCHYAATEKDAFAVCYLLRHGCPPCDLIWTFEGNEFLDILQAYKEAGLAPEEAPFAILNAVQNGDLSLIKRMTDEGFPWTDEACAEAARKGSLETLEFAYTSGAGNLRTVCSDLMGHWDYKSEYRTEEVECFKYAFQRCKRTPYEEYSCQPARDGQLDLLKFLHEQGCKWDANVAILAAKFGHVECLEYLLSHGCPQSKDICIVAFECGEDKCLEVARKYGCV